jgi:hypothetical protein
MQFLSPSGASPIIFLVLLFFLLINSGSSSTACKHATSATRRCNRNPHLLLISLDGFRWDYLKMYHLPAFNYLKSIGTHADFVYNNFVTSTFPNHFSMVTGLYEESHGIINSVMHDPRLNKTFVLEREETHTFEWFGQNPQVEPVWTTNQLAGGSRASLASWPGSDVTFMNESVEEIAFNYRADFKTLINTFIRHFTSSHRPINFGALYFNQPGMFMVEKLN